MFEENLTLDQKEFIRSHSCPICFQKYNVYVSLTCAFYDPLIMEATARCTECTYKVKVNSFGEPYDASWHGVSDKCENLII